MQETWVQSLGLEDPLKEEVATHASILACRIPETEESGGLQSMGLQRVEHHWATFILFNLACSNSEISTAGPILQVKKFEDQWEKIIHPKFGGSKIHSQGFLKSASHYQAVSWSRCADEGWLSTLRTGWVQRGGAKTQRKTEDILCKKKEEWTETQSWEKHSVDSITLVESLKKKKERFNPRSWRPQRPGHRIYSPKTGESLESLRNRNPWKKYYNLHW